MQIWKLSSGMFQIKGCLKNILPMWKIQQTDCSFHTLAWKQKKFVQASHITLIECIIVFTIVNVSNFIVWLCWLKTFEPVIYVSKVTKILFPQETVTTTKTKSYKCSSASKKYSLLLLLIFCCTVQLQNYKISGLYELQIQHITVIPLSTIVTILVFAG